MSFILFDEVIEMNEAVLELRDVTKDFGQHHALQHVTMTVRRGDVYALIGENGAGKTTLMRLITGLSPMGQGEIMLLGENAKHYRHALKRIGAVIETPVAFDKLTVEQNLHVTAIQHGLTNTKEIAEAIGFVGLLEKRKTKAKHLSLGQKQRLGLATAILAHPDFLILDEPINGLDPMGIVEFRQLLHRLNVERQTTILIASHILSELYQVATRFGFLHRGSLIQELTKPELDRANQTGLVVKTAAVEQATQILDQAGITQFTVKSDHELRVAKGQIAVTELNQMLVSAGVAVSEIAEQENSLEEYFTRLIQEQEGTHD